MSNPTLPQRGMMRHSILRKSYDRDGIMELARKLIPDAYLEEAPLVVVHHRIISELLQQVQLRDYYIIECLKSLGFPVPDLKDELDAADWQSIFGDTVSTEVTKPADVIPFNPETYRHKTI